MPDPVGRQRHDGGADIAAGGKELRRPDRIADGPVGDDVEHAGQGAAGGFVDGGDAALGDAAGDEHGVGRIGDADIRVVARLSGHFGAAVDARDVGADTWLFGRGHAIKPSVRQPGTKRG
jgi:hypothetical protein